MPVIEDQKGLADALTTPRSVATPKEPSCYIVHCLCVHVLTFGGEETEMMGKEAKGDDGEASR